MRWWQDSALTQNAAVGKDICNFKHAGSSTNNRKGRSVFITFACKDKDRNKQHETWEDSFDWKYCQALWFMEQKLDYMHNNPCAGKWQLVSSPVEYAHSSAGYYLTGNDGAYAVFHYCSLSDIDLED